jgi:hypothetical protein
MLKSQRSQPRALNLPESSSLENRRLPPRRALRALTPVLPPSRLPHPRLLRLQTHHNRMSPSRDAFRKGWHLPLIFFRFFHNKAALAGVLSAIVISILVALLATLFIIRRRRARRLQNELALAAGAPATRTIHGNDGPGNGSEPGSGTHFGVGGYRDREDDDQSNSRTYSDGVHRPYSDVSSYGTLNQPPMSVRGGNLETYGSPGLGPGSPLSANYTHSNTDVATGLLSPGFTEGGTRQMQELRDVDGMQERSHNLRNAASSSPLHQPPLTDRRSMTPGYQDSLSAYPPSSYPASTLPVYPETVRSHSPPAYSDLSRSQSLSTRSDTTRGDSHYGNMMARMTSPSDSSYGTSLLQEYSDLSTPNTPQSIWVRVNPATGEILGTGEDSASGLGRFVHGPTLTPLRKAF